MIKSNIHNDPTNQRPRTILSISNFMINMSVERNRKRNEDCRIASKSLWKFINDFNKNNKKERTYSKTIIKGTCLKSRLRSLGKSVHINNKKDS